MSSAFEVSIEIMLCRHIAINKLGGCLIDFINSDVFDRDHVKNLD